MSSIYVSAAHKSAGKTICSVAIGAALRQRGYSIQPFKKGPDYIDPLWLARATRRDCHNLDFHTMSDKEIRQVFARHHQTADMSLIEGNKGLHDSVDVEGRFSNASLANLLGAPVLLVIDTRGMTRGVAALLQGLVQFDPSVAFAGVILNRIGGERHEAKLRAAIERYTDLAVLGAMPEHPALAIPAAHLGLVSANETGESEQIIERAAAVANDHLDLEPIVAAASRARLPSMDPTEHDPAPQPTAVRIGIARDEAFGFYYPGDLESLQAAGAELLPLDTLRDTALPCIDGLFLGGGFPERHMRELEANQKLRAAIRAAVEGGLPVYAECGGLMYLSRQISWGDRRCDMVGVLPLDIAMSEKPQGRGYARLRETSNAPWPHFDHEQGVNEFPAHEFHYSGVCEVTEELLFAYEVLRGNGVDGKHDGIVYRNTLSSYTHLRDTACHRWTHRFVAHVKSCGFPGHLPSREIR